MDPLLALGFEGDEIRNTPIHDEPAMSIPRDFPPVGNPSFPDVSARWVKYLVDRGLTPAELGAPSWSGVKPDAAAGYNTGSSLVARRLYYHSVRFVAWDSSRYLAQATRNLESLLAPGNNLRKLEQHGFTLVFSDSRRYRVCLSRLVRARSRAWWDATVDGRLVWGRPVVAVELLRRIDVQVTLSHTDSHSNPHTD